MSDCVAVCSRGVEVVVVVEVEKGGGGCWWGGELRRERDAGAVTDDP